MYSNTTPVWNITNGVKLLTDPEPPYNSAQAGETVSLRIQNTGARFHPVYSIPHTARQLRDAGRRKQRQGQAGRHR